MDKLTKEEKLQVMRQVADIASSVSQSKVTWNIKAMDALVDRLYRRMAGLIERDLPAHEDSDNE